MYAIDKMAATSPLRQVHPGEKAGFALLSLGMVLFSRDILLPAAVFCLMVSVLWRKGRVEPGRIGKLLLIPGAFILTSLVPIVVSVHTHPFPGGRPIGAGGLFWGLSPAGAAKGALLLLRSLSGISCFYFLILTTPVGQIDYLAYRMKISPLFREMMVLIYRYIFLLSELAAQIWNAQKIRFGYKGFGRSLKSMGMLSTAVLTKANAYSDQAGMALEARGCDGATLRFFQPSFPADRKNRLLLVCYGMLLILLKIQEGLWPILN